MVSLHNICLTYCGLLESKDYICFSLGPQFSVQCLDQSRISIGKMDKWLYMWMDGWMGEWISGYMNRWIKWRERERKGGGGRERGRKKGKARRRKRGSKGGTTSLP